MTESLFDQLELSFNTGGTDTVLKELVAHFESEKKFHELFEVLKMQVRHGLGLPLLYGESGDELDSQQRTALEEGLIQACRQVGLGLLEDGRISEGWMYMRPVGDVPAVKTILDEIDVADDNIDEMVEVLLQEGVDPGRGYSIVLQHYGTCNAITTFESVMPQKSKPDQRTVARLLLRHVHQELFANVKSDVAQHLGNEPTGETIAELIADQDGLFGEHAYHIDTTHLASTTRFSRILDDEQSLRLALDLTHYGKNLHDQFQYEGDEPFTDIYPHHAFYFQALLGENVETALAHFKERAENVDVNQWGTVAIEIYIDLLARVGQVEEAIQITVDKIKPGQRTMGHAPSLLELCERISDYSTLVTACRGADDILGFATGLLQAKTN
ncbi:MAG: hypothetical protein VX738_10335 [Planctomycetota bacterium]|nr:hypothetical protein [Planctomycetota bacterium]